ncbi:MAG: recombinase family protein [Candidatus Yonathbacteria bacterium]|nr:recombinase family protein [Candidatus Yonathbacteria bacterium]
MSKILMQNIMLKPKYFLYARKSTEDDDHQIMSIEAQLFELREYARRENVEILQEFTEAKSAKKPGREKFGEMMSLIENSREPMGIISWHPDRLARNSVDGGKIIYLVDTQKIVSLRFPTFWFEPTPQGKFMLQVAFGQSKYYSDNLVENINRGIRQKLRRGEWLTRAPFGYVNNPKTRTIEPHPVHSRIIIKAYKEYAKGTYSYESLAEFLAEHGIVTKSRTPLGKASVARILTNRAYLGFVLHKGEYHDGSFAPILSPTLFEAVQKVLARKAKPRKQKARHDFPFLQLMRCGECGGMITAQYSINRWGMKYTYYHCTKKLGKCSQPYIQESALAAQFHSLLQTVSLPLEGIDTMEKQMNEWERESISSRGTVAQNLKTKLSETKEKLDKLVSIYLDGDIEREIYLERKDLLLRQKAKLEESLADFGRQRKNWVEPLRIFVLSLREATKLKDEQNYSAWRDFFRSIGSNPSLKEKTLSINWGELFEFTAKTKADFGLRSGIFAPQKSRDASVSNQVSLCGDGGN